MRSSRGTIERGGYGSRAFARAWAVAVVLAVILTSGFAGVRTRAQLISQPPAWGIPMTVIAAHAPCDAGCTDCTADACDACDDDDDNDGDSGSSDDGSDDPAWLAPGPVMLADAEAAYAHALASRYRSFVAEPSTPPPRG